MKVSRLRLAFVFLMVSSCAFSQRHGDSGQSYTASLRPPNPILSINTQAPKTWQHFHLSDLRKMDHQTVDVIDPTTKVKSVYKGVSLSQLIPGAANSRVEVFQEWGFGTKKVRLDASLSQGSHVLVADTLDGKRLPSDQPYR